jgi:hypothetical protein
MGTIAEQNQEGRDAIRTAIQELEESGYLKRTQVNENGRFGEAIWTTTDPTDFPSSDFPSSDNPTLKNTNTKEYQVKNKRIYAHDELFLEFWKEYPRKQDKGKAKKAFASALTRASLEDILAGVIRYRSDPNRLDEYTKYPASWLNADAWENGPLPERSKKQAVKTNWDKLDQWVKEQEDATE